MPRQAVKVKEEVEEEEKGLKGERKKEKERGMIVISESL